MVSLPLAGRSTIYPRIYAVRGARLCASLLSTNFGRGIRRAKEKWWMQVEFHPHPFGGGKVQVEHLSFTFKNDDLIGFSQDSFVIVIHVVMDGVPTSDQGELRFKLRLCGHLAQVAHLLGT